MGASRRVSHRLPGREVLFSPDKSSAVLETIAPTHSPMRGSRGVRLVLEPWHSFLSVHRWIIIGPQDRMYRVTMIVPMQSLRPKTERRLRARPFVPRPPLVGSHRDFGCLEPLVLQNLDGCPVFGLIGARGLPAHGP